MVSIPEDRLNMFFETCFKAFMALWPNAWTAEYHLYRFDGSMVFVAFPALFFMILGIFCINSFLL